MADYNGGRVFLQVVPSFVGFNDRVRQEGERAGANYRDGFDKEASKSSPDVGLSESEARTRGQRSGGIFAEQFRRQIDRALKALPEVELPVKPGSVDAQIRRYRKELENLRGMVMEPNFNGNVVAAEMERLREKGQRLSRETVDIKARADFDKAYAELSVLSTQVRQLDGRTININAKAEDNFPQIRSNLNSLVGRTVFLTASLTTLTPAFLAVGAAGIGAMAGITVGAGAAAVGLGTLAIGLRGVGDAVDALERARAAAPEDARAAADRAATSAESIANAQRQIESAERGLANARRTSADQAEDAARRVADAQEEVGRVAVQAARAVETAVRRQRSAEQSLADAQQNTVLAQEDLTRARERAREAIEDLELATRAASLAEEDAQLALERAQANLTNLRATQIQGIQEAEQAVLRARDRLDAIVAGPGTAYEIEIGTLAVTAAEQRLAALRTEQAALVSGQSIDAREAELAVRQAQLRLEEARRRNVETQEEAARAQAAGVDGAEAVLDAERRLAAARRAEAEAQQATVDAAQALVDAQVDGQRRVADAHEAVTLAVQNQQRQQEASAFAIVGAVASVEGAYAALAAAQRNAATEMSASQRALQDAMAQLSPAGQAFALFWHNLTSLGEDGTPGALLKMQWEVQEALLPRMQQAIEKLLPHMDSITGFLVDMAEVAGDLAIRFAEAFAGEEMRPFFEMIANLGPDVFRMLGEMALNLVVAFANLAVAFAPLGVDVIEGMAGAVDKLAKSTEDLDTNQDFQDFLGYIREVGPIVVDMFVALGGAIANIARALGPYGPIILQGLTEFFRIIAGMDPDQLASVVLGISSMVTAFQLMGLVTTLAALTMGGWVIVIGLFAAALIYAYTEFEWFRDFINVGFKVLGEAISIWWNYYVKPTFYLLEALIKDVVIPVLQWLWDELGEGLEFAWSRMEPIFDAIGEAVGLLPDAFRAAGRGISGAMREIQEFVRNPIDYVIEHVFRPLVRGFNWIAEKVGIPGIDEGRIPSVGAISNAPGTSTAGSIVPGMAEGGIYPGYTPGRDIGYIGVSGGEAIMRPEWTRAIGADTVHEMNRIARTGGVEAVRHFLGLYATGGVIPFLGHFDKGGPVGVGKGVDRNFVGDVVNLGQEGLEAGAQALGAITGAVGDFVIGQFRRAAEALINPLIEKIPGGGFIRDLTVGTAKTLAEGLFDFADGKDKESIALGTGAFGRQGGAWPPINFGGNALNTIAAMAYVEKQWGDVVGAIGGWRKAGSVSTSDHPKGKALDIMIDNWQKATGIAAGNMIANWFVENPGAFGTKYIIWRDMINSGAGWRPYRHPSDPSGRNSTLAHRDHVHVSLFDSGGRLDPGLSMVANHSGHRELVLTHDQEGALAAAIRDMVRAGNGGRPTQIIVQGNAYRGVEDEIATVFDRRAWMEGVGALG